MADVWRTRKAGSKPCSTGTLACAGFAYDRKLVGGARLTKAHGQEWLCCLTSRVTVITACVTKSSTPLNTIARMR